MKLKDFKTMVTRSEKIIKFRYNLKKKEGAEVADVLFRKVEYPLKKLIEDIDLGEIALPDIQRPFVWGTSKVRDLFDSMYRGYPIGYFLFWESGYSGEHRVIGTDRKQKTPRLLVVDGQQRLTSLYAVMKDRTVFDKNFRKIKVRIAFHPLEEKFEVSNPAIERDVMWIPDISRLWDPANNLYTFIRDYLWKVKEKHSVSVKDEDKISKAIERLYHLQDYPITSLEVSSSVDEEQVAEIFVRINSKGTPLNQADFILTLMSVFWDDGRKELEKFCRRAKLPSVDGKPSPYNHYIQPSPDRLLRVEVALGFRRARLEHVYSLLRGKDLQTRKFSEEQRDKQFKILKEAQRYTLDLQNWHEFLKVLKRAGYPGYQLISSDLAVLYTYALWLIGKRDFNVDIYNLREIMARWFFMVVLTGRYTDSPESRMEQDLAMLRDAKSPDDFINVLDKQIKAIFTRDYWEVTLPNELEASSARNRGQFAHFAALYMLNAPVLYSKMRVPELLDPVSKSKRSSLERHHLFPRAYLERIGIRDRRLINQVANYALVEWSDNMKIGDRSPAEYVPEMEMRFSPQELEEMYFYHALPEKWYEMKYLDFLEERRKRIAEVIRHGFSRLEKGY